jgi:hypothetical protein
MSDWRRNYMRTLELRTINPKRILKLNVAKDGTNGTAGQGHGQDESRGGSSLLLRTRNEEGG